MLYKQLLENVYHDLERVRKDLDAELKSLPEGSLNIDNRGHNEFYKIHLPKKGNRKKDIRKGITKDKALVSALVRKRYVENAVSILDSDIAMMEKMLKSYQPVDENSVMAEFVSRHPALADDIYRNVDETDTWASDYERQKDFYDDDRTSVAGDGTVMRSRGEIIIAEKLRQYNIPFRYEASLGIPDLAYVPDFTIKRPRDSKIFFWEHFGDVNDDAYMARNARKLERYEEYGIVPWDNLIVTYDLTNGGVNVPLIEAMISAWLL